MSGTHLNTPSHLAPECDALDYPTGNNRGGNCRGYIDYYRRGYKGMFTIINIKAICSDLLQRAPSIIFHFLLYVHGLTDSLLMCTLNFKHV